MVAFAGGGVLLAGVSLAALIRYRRRQFRWRHPGRTDRGDAAGAAARRAGAAVDRRPGMADVTWLERGAAQPGPLLGDCADAASPA